MKKVLASIGIGNASVDTILPRETVQPGETLDAEVQIVGGNAEQEIGDIRFEVETKFRTEDGYREFDIDTFTLAESLTIRPDQHETRPVQIAIPYETPVTMGNIEVWVETELDIDMAIDPEDKDYLDVRPTPRLQAAFDAMEELGFSFYKADCEADPYNRYTSSRFIQEFEFRPQSGPYRGDLDEVELVARPGPSELTLFVEVDRRGGLLSEMTDTDETTVQTSVTSTDVRKIADELDRLIQRHA